MEEIISMVTNHGLAITISVIVIYFAVKTINVLFEDFKSKKGVKSHDELTIFRNQINSTINALLERTLLKTQACRASAIQGPRLFLP